MANYHYDEAGNMAAYFLITFLAFILIPLTVSLRGPTRKLPADGCQCQPCLEQRASIRSRERGSLLNPNMSIKAVIVIFGWSFFTFLAYKTSGATLDNKVYDPFEILGLRAGVTEKDIKSHFKKLSKLYHPDKVKISGNETIESIANKFVDITKAYKSLTDETVRRNWELYGHPDGRQEVSMGIALPQWIIEGKNNIWVLGMYGVIFGGVLPVLVGRWWFGSRQKTKDGVNALSAASFFKSLSEESGMEDVIATLCKSYAWEYKSYPKNAGADIEELERTVISKMGADWRAMLKLTEVGKASANNEPYMRRKRALVLLYAHFLRIEVVAASLQNEQTNLLLHVPILLNALLNIATSRNWLAPTLSVMRLHGYLAQALLPGKEQLKFAQLPGINIGEKWEEARTVEDFVWALEQKGDDRVTAMNKVLERWGRLELVDASFKVIGERLVTPSSIVFLVVKLRIAPPRQSLPLAREKIAEDTKRVSKMNEEKDSQFLFSKKDAEDESAADVTSGWGHAPYWPGFRKPSWWLVLADEKSNRLVVPPMKITDVPLSKPERERDYRSYKLQFQAPNSVGLFTWKAYLVSDTFVGEEICKNIALRIDDVSALNADEYQAEDEISDPEEDSLAGQMAAMRGGAVKKSQQYDQGSDDESTTDDDQESGSDSGSDSD